MLLSLPKTLTSIDMRYSTDGICLTVSSTTTVVETRLLPVNRNNSTSKALCVAETKYFDLSLAYLAAICRSEKYSRSEMEELIIVYFDKKSVIFRKAHTEGASILLLTFALVLVVVMIDPGQCLLVAGVMVEVTGKIVMMTVVMIEVTGEEIYILDSLHHSRRNVYDSSSGFELDAFARSSLWKIGLDYHHGTGHGIGAALNVHEGPQSIGFRFGNMTPLLKGMNLLHVKEANTPNYFGGVTKFVDLSLLSTTEKEWLDNYHKHVQEKYLMLASGRASVFILYARTKRVIKVWDHAVGVICINEVGGKIGEDIPDRTLEVEKIFQIGQRSFRNISLVFREEGEKYRTGSLSIQARVPRFPSKEAR
ncbi:hypothetical protein ACS0TY_009347 [Phlomoides rotata]